MENENEITVKKFTVLLKKIKKRLSVSNHSEQTIVNYLRAVEYLCKYTGKSPQETEIDEVSDYFELPPYEKPKRILVFALMKLVYKVDIGVCKHCGGKLRLIESKGRPRASPKVA